MALGSAIRFEVERGESLGISGKSVISNCTASRNVVATGIAQRIELGTAFQTALESGSVLESGLENQVVSESTMEAEADFRNVSEGYTDELAYPSGYEDDFTVALVKYVVPLFIVVGLIGNSLTIAVLWRRGVRKSTTIFYLTALSMSDVISILIGLPTYWLSEVLDVQLREMSQLICKLQPFLVYSTTHFIVWILVLVTVDRLLWVAAPFQAKSICTMRNATVALVTTGVILLCANSPFIWMLNLQTVNYTESSTVVLICAASPEYEFFSDYVVPLIDLFVYSLLPFTIMIIANAVIICKLHVYATKRNLTLKKSSSSLHSLNANANLCRLTSNSYNGLCRLPSLPMGDSCNSMSTIGINNVNVRHPHAIRAKKSRRFSMTKMSKESHLTTMLLTVNIFFILTTLPITISNILYRVYEERQLQDLQWAQSIGQFQTVSHLLNYLNITVHFVLYCLSGKAFRDDVLVLLKLRKPKQPIKRQLERLTSIQPDFNTCGF